MFVLPVSSSLHRRALRGAPHAFAHLLAERAFDAAAEEAPRDETRVPHIDVLESDNAYSVVLDMPGAAKEQLKVSEIQMPSSECPVTSRPEGAPPSPGSSGPRMPWTLGASATAQGACQSQTFQTCSAKRLLIVS